MAKRILPPPSLLCSRLQYDPSTGDIIRRPRSRDEFTKDRIFKTWNTRFSGKIATSDFKDGYLTVQVDSQNWLAHRVAFAIYYGRWPNGQIDHINGNRSDNRIDNLREVSNLVNSKNTGIRKNNKTGVLGVKYEPRNTNKPWIANIKVNGEGIYLGSFPDKKSAIQARRDADIKYGYHINHGTRAAIPKEAA